MENEVIATPDTPTKSHTAIEIIVIVIAICTANIFAPWYIVTFIGTIAALSIKRAPMAKIILASIVATLITLLIDVVAGGNVLANAQLTSSLAAIGPSATSFAVTFIASIAILAVGAFFGSSLKRVVSELLEGNQSAPSQENLGSFTTKPVE